VLELRAQPENDAGVRPASRSLDDDVDQQPFNFITWSSLDLAIVAGDRPKARLSGRPHALSISEHGPVRGVLHSARSRRCPSVGWSLRMAARLFADRRRVPLSREADEAS